MSYLRDSDREALRLAHDLREEMRAWLANRGVDAPLSVSPFVDPGGQPSVLVTMSADVVRALSSMLAEQRGQAAGRPGPDNGFQRQMTDTGGIPAISDTGSFRAVHNTNTGGFPALSDSGSFPAVSDTGGFRHPQHNGAPAHQPNGAGFPQPVNGLSNGASYPQAADAGFRQPYQQPYQQPARPPHR